MEEIEWMTRDAFIEMYDATYKPIRVSLDHEMSADATLGDLRMHIGVDGAVNPPEAEGEPGPCVRWYGRTRETLFFITGYESTNLAVLTTRRAAQGYTWSVLDELGELKWFWKQLTWLRTFKDGPATDAVCRRDQWGIRLQVYGSDDRQETMALLDVLSRLAGAVDVFYRCEPDPMNRTWASFDEQGKLLGRYVRRDSIESLARRISERSAGEVVVVEEPTGRVWSRFREGRLIEAN